MEKARIFVTRVIPEPGIQMLREFGEVEVWPGETPPAREELARRLPLLDGLLTNLSDHIDADLIALARKLKVISNFANGYSIDVEACTRRGICVCHTPGGRVDTVADFAFALLLTLARRVTEAVEYVRAGRWQATWGPTLLLGQEVSGATLGIVGLGRVGREMARRARGFDMRILYFDPVRQPELERELGLIPADMETLLKESDFVSLHARYEPGSPPLIGAQELALMKPTALLINTARGQLIDQKALYEALKAGRPAGAALDVVHPDPIDPEDPLLTLPNVLITPHVASASRETREMMARVAAQNLIAVLKGERPLHPVNPEVLGSWTQSRS